MYNIGICDDGENICTSIENMLLQYAQEKNIRIDTNVWYTGESLRDYLVSGAYLDILILDEPMNALDNNGVEDMRKVLLKMKEKGKLIIIASYVRDDIDILCDEVYGMDAGIMKKIH